MAVLWCLAIVLLVLTSIPRVASAQVLYGSIVGTLTDQTGAVVPKATVTVTNTSTGLSRQVTADGAGYYSIPNLLEGTYDRTVTSSGFKPYAQKGVIVSVNNVTRVDVNIQLGALRRRHRRLLEVLGNHLQPVRGLEHQLSSK